MEDVLTIQEQSLNEEAVQNPTQNILAHSVNVADANQVDELEDLVDGMTGLERKEYWATQSSLSTVSAVTPSYEDACQELDYDPLNSTPFRALWEARQALIAQAAAAAAAAEQADDQQQVLPPGGPAGEVLQLNGWQVTGIAWALQQEELRIRDGIIADDCGTGKTIIMLTVILERVRAAILAMNKAPLAHGSQTSSSRPSTWSTFGLNKCGSLLPGSWTFGGSAKPARG